MVALAWMHRDVGRLVQETLPAGSGVHWKEAALGGNCSAVPGAAVAVILGPGWWLVCCRFFWAPWLCARCSPQPALPGFCCTSAITPPLWFTAYPQKEVFLDGGNNMKKVD